MLRSQPPTNPHTRSKRKRKPPWTDPSTRVTVSRALIVTVIDAHKGRTTLLIPKRTTREVLSAILFAFRHQSRGGTK